METELVLCDCHHPEHQFLLTKDPDDLEFIYLSIHLPKLNFFCRVRYAIRYILGHRSKFGAFEELILNQKQREKVISFLR